MITLMTQLLIYRRFKLFKKFIDDTDFDCYLFCDCHDVVIINNPFYIMKPDVLYSGSENFIIGDYTFCKQWFPNLNVDYTNFGDKILLNCGIIGGYREIMTDFYQKYVKNIEASEIDSGDLIDSGQFNYIDMIMFNKTIYENPYDVVTGYPFHTEFKKYQVDDTNAYISHK